MTKSRILLCILLSFIAGVFVRSFFEISQSFDFFFLILSILLLTIFYKNKLAALAAFMLLSFVFGLQVTDNDLQKVNKAALSGETFKGSAVVIKNSTTSIGQNLIIELSDQSIIDSSEKLDVLLQAPEYPKYNYGDLLDVSCTAKAIENKDASFDYRMYMAKEGVLYSCENKKFAKIGENKGNVFLADVLHLRTLFENNIDAVIPVPEGSLADGLLFGGSAGLSKQIQADFSRTGMTHIVAVSGYNVTIIAEYLILLGIFLGLWRKQAIWFALFGIAIFVIMSGLPASAVRAGVMSAVILWAMKNGRLASAENAIIFAGAIMLFLNPLLLRWDVGFQLSFLATLGIVLSSPFWEKSFIKNNKALGISEAIALSLSAQIFVLPIIAYNFHIASVVSLLANVFILPIIPLSMLLVFLVSIAGFVLAPLSVVFAWLSYLPLHYELWLIHTLAEFPWASVQVENMSGYFIEIYYSILMVIIFWLRRSQISMSNKIQKT